MSEKSPSPERNELHDIDDAAACALVDEMLGAAHEWRSPIIKYRFTSDFQAHWKAEIGHWVNTARVHGYESRLVERTRARANDARRRIPDDVTTADLLYRVILEELHPAMVAHYLLKTGWGFRAWDTPDGAGGDVDLAVTSPDGVPVDIQIKVPGSENPIAALEKGARQLLATENRALIFVCSRDPVFVSCEPGEFLVGLLGNTVGEHGVVTLTERRAGLGRWNGPTSEPSPFSTTSQVPNGRPTRARPCSTRGASTGRRLRGGGFRVRAFFASKATAFDGIQWSLTGLSRCRMEPTSPNSSGRLAALRALQRACNAFDKATGPRKNRGPVVEAPGIEPAR
ncbi:MAG: hypothetical protein M3O50_07555 [Myxococcota bacterium]|nr:hypothetical protein [Myxococcota bacterium]